MPFDSHNLSLLSSAHYPASRPTTEEGGVMRYLCVSFVSTDRAKPIFLMPGLFAGAASKDVYHCRRRSSPGVVPGYYGL